MCLPKNMASIIDHFGSLPDPRTKEYKKEHKLIDVLFITIAAVICGAEDWNEIGFYGQEQDDWLKTILELPFGIPSHVTFNRMFSLVDPTELQAVHKLGAVHSQNKRRAGG